MKRLSRIVLFIAFFSMGCSVGFVNKETTLREQPFAIETLRGNITEATRCVGRYWQKSVLPEGAWWKVNPESLPILASGIGLGLWETPVSLVIDFAKVDGKTIARAYMHRSVSAKDERRTITMESLAACRGNTQSYYEGVKAIVLNNGDIIEGEITSIENGVLKIRTKEGRILPYSFVNDVKQYIMK